MVAPESVSQAKPVIDSPQSPAAAGRDVEPKRRAKGVFHRSPTLLSAMRAVAAILLAFLITAIPIAMSGKSPLAAYGALVHGAFGSFDHVTFALNKSTPYILIAVGIALCFRAGIINIGGEGQVAIGALAASWVALNAGVAPVIATALSLVAGAAMGGVWAGVAAAIRLTRGVHEVLSTLLLNFIALLVETAALNGPMGESGSCFPQSPLFADGVSLPKLLAGSELHTGFVIALLAAVFAQIFLWRTRFGFRLRLLGGSRSAADYAGVSFSAGVMSAMMLSGALAGLAGAVEVLGVHYRLIDGFSQGFGFSAIAVALLGAADPLAGGPGRAIFWFSRRGSACDATRSRRSVIARVCHSRSQHRFRAMRDGTGSKEARVMDSVFTLGLWAAAIRVAAPLIMGALGGLLSERAGVFAVGIEGMMLAGAFGTAITTFATGSSLLGLLAAMFAGALLAMLVAIAVTKFQADQMVTGLAINILAFGLTSFLIRGLFHGQAPVMRIGLFGALPIPVLSRMPVVGAILFRQPVLTYAAVLLATALHFFLYRTNAGLALRATGENPEAVYAAGHNPVRIRQLAVIAGGAVAGLGGAVLVLQDVGTFTDGMTGGRGFLALAALIVGRWKPFGALLACVVFGAASALEVRLEGAGLPVSSYVIQMLPYVIALFVLAGLGRRTRMPQAIGRAYQMS